MGDNKKDFFPVEDVSTDRSALEVNTAFAGISMMSHTSVRAWVNFTLGATPQIADGYTAWDAQWKSATPTLPIIANTGTGIYTVTFPAQVEDDMKLGNLHSLNFRSVQASFMTSSASPTLGICITRILAPYQIEVKVYSATTITLNNLNNQTIISLWII